MLALRSAHPPPSISSWSRRPSLLSDCSRNDSFICITCRKPAEPEINPTPLQAFLYRSVFPVRRFCRHRVYSSLPALLIHFHLEHLHLSKQPIGPGCDNGGNEEQFFVQQMVKILGHMKDVFLANDA